MAAPVTQAFLDEQARTTREPKKLVLMRLRNVASAGMGAIASSPHTLDTDHPPVGAIDDDLTHINFGPAAGADNGIGLSGWKSTDAGVLGDWDTISERLADAIAADAIHKMGTVFSSGTDILANTKHNILLRSEELDTVAWTAIGVTLTADAAFAPDGTATAERLTEIANTGQHGVKQSMTKLAGSYIPASFFVRLGTRPWCYIEVGDGGANQVRQFFDLSTPAIGTAVVNGVGWAVVGTPRIKPVRGRIGWLRVDVVVSAPSAAVAADVGLFLSTGDTVETYLGDITENLYVWGGQALDGGENPGPYTKTIASAIWAHGAGFDTMTPAASLGGQRTWLQGVQAGAGQISVQAGVGHSGAQGVLMQAPGPILAQDNVRLPLRNVPSSLIIFQFWAAMREAGRTIDHVEFCLGAGTVRLFGLWIDGMTGPVGGFNQPQPLQLIIGAGAPFAPTDGVIIQDDVWNQFTIVVDRTTPATSDVRIFHRRETGIGVFDPEVHWECWRGTVNTTGLDRFHLHVDNLTPTAPPEPVWWVDQLLIHTGHEAESVYAQLLDIGAAPTGTAGRITLEAGAEPVRRIIPGASYAFSNIDRGSGLRNATAQTATGFTFTPTAAMPIDSMRVRMNRVGNPEGNLWAEIRAISGGIPTKNVLARSAAHAVRWDVSPDAGDIIFEFPQPMVPDGSSLYGLQLVGDWPIDGVNYVILRIDGSAPTYSGQYFHVDDEPWGTPTYTFFPGADMPFIMYSHHRILETFDKATIDTDLQLMDVTSVWHLAQGFEVDRTLDFQHLHVAVKALLPAAIGKDALGIWFDLHADDGTGEKPSNTILATGAIVDPGEMAWTTYDWFVLRLVTRYPCQPGVRYWWVVKGNANFGPGGAPNGSDMIAFGADDSAPTYARGNRAYSNNADPAAWTSVPGGAMAFRIMELERPHFQLRANYSEDDLTYGAVDVLAGNSARLGDPQGTFTGDLAQFWLARAIAVCMGGAAEFGPSATDLTMRNIHAVERELTINFGQQRQIDMVRLFAHPTEGGLRRVRMETSTDGIAFDTIENYETETLESYSKGDPDDKGVTIIEAEGAFIQTWLENFNAYINGELAGQGPWYKTAAMSGNNRLWVASTLPIEAPKDAELDHYNGILEFAAQFPGGRTEQSYRFNWKEKRRAQNIAKTRYVKFADQADAGADAWAVEITGSAGLADVRVRDAGGLSGIIYQQGFAIVDYRVVVDADSTLRFYVDDGGGWVLKYTGLSSKAQADRVIIRCSGGGSGFASYDVLLLEEKEIIPGALVIGGEYVGARFLSTLTASHLKIIVLESEDGFARLLEVQAFQVVDVSDRVLEMTESQGADFLMLRIKQRRLSLVLTNTDRVLSSRNPNGPYFGQLGGGVELIAYMGYLGAPDMVKQGIFYVDTWGESATGTEAIIAATDGVKRIDTDVQANHRVAPRYLDIMEYLANLTNLPSQFQALERAAGTVDYFAADRANAWSEIQKIGEAASGSRVWFDRHGRLRMRLTGSSAADTRMNALLAQDNFRRAFGPPVFIGSKMYVAIIVVYTDGDGDHEQLKVVEYDTDAGTWQYVAASLPINSISPIGEPETGEQHGFAMLAVFDEELYVFFHYNPVGELGLRIVKWDGAYIDTGRNWQVVYERGNTIFGEHRQEVGGTFFRQVHPRAHVRQWLPTFGSDLTSGLHHRFNMFNMWHVLMAGANQVDGAVTVQEPTGEHVYFTRVAVDGDLHFNRLLAEQLGTNPAWLEVRVMAFISLSPEVHSGPAVVATSMGLATDGDGNLLTSLVARIGTMEGRIYQQHRTGGTVRQSPAFYDGSQAAIDANSRNGLAIMTFGDLIITGGQRSTPGGPELHVALWDRIIDEVVDVRNISMSNTRMIGFAKTTVDDQDVLYAIADEGTVIEMYVRRRMPLQAAPVHEITDDIDGAFVDAAIDAGDDDGESRIINTAIINSNPLTAQPTEKIWEGRQLPWPLTWNTKLDFPARLREMALPYDAGDATAQRLTITFNGIFGYTATLSPHHKRPRVTVTITSGPQTGGQLTGIEINGKTLKKNSSLVGVVVGHKDSIARYDIRRRTFDNDYIYDNFSQSIVAASVVARHQFERLRVNGVTIRALWDIEMFDLLTLRETERLFLNGVFYMVTFTRAYHGSQPMSLGLEEGIV